MKAHGSHLIIFALATIVGVAGWLLTNGRAKLNAYEDFSRRLLIHSDDVAFVFMDLEGTIVGISPAAADLLGWGDAVGKNSADLMPEDRREQHAQAVAGSTMEHGDARLIECRSADGDPLALIVIRYRVDDYEGYAGLVFDRRRFDMAQLERAGQ